MMKIATLRIHTFTVQCPHCMEETTAPNGSYMWIVDEHYRGQKFECAECGKPFLLPAIVRDNRLLKA